MIETLPLPDGTDLLALHRLAPSRWPLLLESVAHGTAQGRWDMLLMANGEGIELGVGTLDENASVRAPERLLQELLANLIGNAILHMGRAGHITVSAVSTEHEVALTVADDGIGIPEALREKVFERFFRIDESNPDGFGLGMAIVREICDSLGAKIALSSSAEGRGLRVDILFPRSTVIECG